MKIYYLPKFIKQYKKIPENIKIIATKKISLFKINPFDPRLKIHKLHGVLGDFWSFSINYKYRLIFDFEDKNIVRFYSIRNHDIYEQ